MAHSSQVNLPEYPPESERKYPDRYTGDIIRDSLSPEYWELENACVGGDIETVWGLLEWGGLDVDKPLDGDGCTPLMIACRTGNAELAGVLVEEFGADLDGPISRCGFRAIDFAAKEGYRWPNDIMLADYLRAKGSNFTWWGACYYGDSDRLKEYLDHGQDINEVNPVIFNQNAFECCMHGGHMKLAHWLVSQGALIAVRNCKIPESEAEMWSIGRGDAFYYKEKGIEGPRPDIEEVRKGGLLVRPASNPFSPPPGPPYAGR